MTGLLEFRYPVVIPEDLDSSSEDEFSGDELPRATGDSQCFIIDKSRSEPGSQQSTSTEVQNSKSEEEESKRIDIAAMSAKLLEPDELLKKSIISPGFQQKATLSPQTSTRAEKRLRKKEREKTKGELWYGLPATEVTEERQRDLEIIRMQKAIDPKRFYKKNDSDTLPKYYQIGRVVEHATDFYHSRVPNKQRKPTIVEELLADADFKRYGKKKYAEIVVKKKAAIAAHKRMKRLKKKKR